MSRPRDGETREVAARLVYAYVEGDPSVGLNNGWVLVSLDVGRHSLEFETANYAEGVKLERQAGRVLIDELPDTFDAEPEPELPPRRLL